MAALRIELCDENVAFAPRPERPRLVLQDTTLPPKGNRLPTPAPRRRKRGWERTLFGTATAAVVLFGLGSLGASLWHSAVAPDPMALVEPAPVVTVTVHSGDTLWRYAARYGSSDSYVLDRVEAIARANNLPTDAPLVPGQHLRIRVTNPMEIAKLQRARQTPVASLPR